MAGTRSAGRTQAEPARLRVRCGRRRQRGHHAGRPRSVHPPAIGASGAAVRDTGIELFGRRLPAPLLLAPIGALGILHRDAGVAVSRATAEHGVPYIFSNHASRSMEECAAVMGNSPRWFQLYWSTCDDLVASLVGRAEAAGREAIVVTLDSTLLGWRSRDLDRGYLPFALADGIAQYTSDPVFADMVAGRDSGSRPRRPAVRSQTCRPPGWRCRPSWRRTPGRRWPGATLAQLRAMTSLPIVLKGVQRADDARRAVDAGANGTSCPPTAAVR